MPTQIRLTAMPEDTQFAPLGVLGYCLTRTNFLAPAFAEVRLPLKTVDHAPTDKLGRSMLNGGTDTTGQSELGARVIGAPGAVAAPSAMAARDSATAR